MWRIRIHGRGGQGIKTASQILGSAGFYSGFQAQDFPLYGAERRGAPVIAFSRISKDVILERGPISSPDIILIGDDTLLNDPQSAPLCGAEPSTVIFVNSTYISEQLSQKFSVISADLTGLCLHHLDNQTIYSSALSAVGARLLGNIKLQDLLQAVEDELTPQGISEQKLKANLDLTREIFGIIQPVVISERALKAITAKPLVCPNLLPVVNGAPIILEPGNMALRKTGNWRVERPKIDYESCNNCLICYARCPDGVIGLNSEGGPEIDYEHCKGCLICAQECPGHFIQTVRETGIFP
jgi:pyruvate ferredoxin oxidoreductase gamma subunit